jgi:MFS family permease
VLALICAGLGQSAGFMASTNLLLETCRHDNRLAHMTVGNMLLAPVTIGAPLIAAQSAAHFGSRPVFGASVVLSICAVAWLTLRLREPRSLPDPRTRVPARVGSASDADAAQPV